VLSVNNVVLGAVYPLAAALQGALADRFGLREVTAVTAVLMLGALVVVRTTRPGYANAVDDPLVSQPRVDPATVPASRTASG
jgi:predicted MFS family arabinose efflux permease